MQNKVKDKYKFLCSMIRAHEYNPNEHSGFNSLDAAWVLACKKERRLMVTKRGRA